MGTFVVYDIWYKPCFALKNGPIHISYHFPFENNVC